MQIDLVIVIGDRREHGPLLLAHIIPHHLHRDVAGRRIRGRWIREEGGSERKEDQKGGGVEGRGVECERGMTGHWKGERELTMAHSAFSMILHQS